MKDLLCALGLLLLLEGLPYFLSPSGMKRLMAQIPHLPNTTLRIVGFCAMLAGLMLVYFGRL